MQNIEIKLFKEIKDYIEIIPSLERTYIIIAAINKDKSKNSLVKINCRKGLPISGYVYDSQSDNYHIECCDFLHLGFVPLSFIQKIKGVPNWQIKIPMSENSIKKQLTSLQKKDLKNFKLHFTEEEYEFEYIQMIDPN